MLLMVADGIRQTGRMLLMVADGTDTPGGVEKRMWSPPPAMGRRRGGHPLCGVLLRHGGLDTPRSGVERRVWSPPPAMGRRRGGHPLCGVLMMAACWVGHPTEWGGEDSVVPPARDGQEARWTPLCGVLLMAA